MNKQFCQECGVNIEENTSFCQQCGTEQQAVDAPIINNITCESCQHSNTPFIRFCEGCGDAISVHCPNCKHLNEKGSEQCVQCQINLLDAVKQTSAVAVEYPNKSSSKGKWAAIFVVCVSAYFVFDFRQQALDAQSRASEAEDEALAAQRDASRANSRASEAEDDARAAQRQSNIANANARESAVSGRYTIGYRSDDGGYIEIKCANGSRVIGSRLSTGAYSANGSWDNSLHNVAAKACR